jgi:chemotaxis protein histidine kinase CheA
MATLTEYFETEARDCLAQLDRDLERPRPDAALLQRIARALRGSAQMAREERVVRVAGMLEAVARGVVGGGMSWSPELAARARQTVADLRVLVDRRQASASLDAVAAGAVARWRELGVTAAPGPVRRAPEARASGTREFRAFAAREVSAIAEALDRGVQQLSAAPMDREPLKMILRRQRALLGAARLQEIPVIAEILRAIDDLTRVIAKLDVGVKREWLDIYRIAREGLRATVQPLQQDEDPPASHALSRLRHMREELLERYGAGEIVSAADESAGFTQATPLERAPDSSPPQDTSTVFVETAVDTAPVVSADSSSVAELLLDDEVVLHAETEDPAPAASTLDAEEELLLVDEAIEEEPVLELVDVEEESVLELADIVDAPFDVAPRMAETVLELDEASIVAAGDGESGLALDTAAAESATVPIESLLYERKEALRRALELRDLVALSAIDPVTHEAIDELFDLIEIALR